MDDNNEDEVLEFRSVTLVVVPNRLPRYDEGWIPAHRDLCLPRSEFQREEEDEEDRGDIEEMEGRGDRMELSFEGRRALYEFLGVWDETDEREEDEDEEEESDGDCEWDVDEDDEDDDDEDGEVYEDKGGVIVLRCRGQ